MGWFKKLRKKVETVAKDFLRTPGRIIRQPIDVVRGKTDLDDAVKNSVRAVIRPFKSTAKAAAELDRIAQQLTVKIAAKVGGEKAANLMADINYVARAVVDPALGVAVLESVDRFVETGDLEYLNPINIYALREIQQTRERIWEAAHAIPQPVLDALPPAVSTLASGVRWILESEIPGDLHLPSFALNHVRHAGAITLIDVIVFKRLPGPTDDEDKFLWSHELYHTHQYRSMGIETFTKQYLGNEFGFRAAGKDQNAFEVQADMFACRYFPTASPKYLPGGVCPVP
ncbi:MAG: DUF4157 domain-containing protein [Burkholderiaceae bacterium]|nr:DUF4157 domain-containing protein [Burkholderiaceae bacterium]